MLTTELKGARTHNLKSVDLSLVPGEIVVLTGVSGAGKSSLALDTLYAEGQRRFVESFSPYARQFLERLERPPMDSLEPVPAAVAVDRSAPVKSSRSSVATMADLEPYLSALFTRESLPVCPEHGSIGRLLDAAGAARVLAEDESLQGAEPILLGYVVNVASREHYLELREALAEAGLRRLFLKGELRKLDDVKPSEASKQRVAVVIDRIKPTPKELSRIAEGIELAFQRGNGSAWIGLPDGNERLLSSGYSCALCEDAGTPRRLEAPRPGLFSYESPLGACGECRGFGRVIGVDPDKVIPNPDLPLSKGVIRPWARGKSTTWERRELKKYCERVGVPWDKPWSKLSKEQQRLVLEGDGDWKRGHFPGVLGWFRWLETRTYKMHVRVFLSRYRAYDVCPSCNGKRLNAHALGYQVGGLNLAEWHALEIQHAHGRIAALATHSGQGELARSELESRLGYLHRVGLGYLTLDRQARSLSGGETQRVTLTAALGTSLHNALFVLDEPTVGLHALDIEPLTKLLRELADRGNAVVVVEHDPLLIAAADRVIELGPGAGEAGGHIVRDSRLTPKSTKAAKGTASKATSKAKSTKQKSAGKAKRASEETLLVADAGHSSYSFQAPAYERERRQATQWLELTGAAEHNLKGIDVRFPLGVVCAVTGPSGSGKSSLVEDVLGRAVQRALGDFDVPRPGAHTSLSGTEALKRVILVDQSPLGRTSRGNAATYTKAWDRVRALYAARPLAKANAIPPSAFSFNVDGGRCEACKGEGFETVEMQFLADVRLSCPVCGGKRFKPHVLAVEYAGVDIAQLLDTTVDDALVLFDSQKEIQRTLGPVSRLGLGYLRLGQPLSTLSGGEAQRLKLARALCERLDGALLILDEPSAGLHSHEVGLLLRALDDVLRAGGSVLLVDHDLEVIRAADWVIDLGPQGGAGGGEVVAVGAPQSLKRGATADALRLGAGSRVERIPAEPSRAVLSVERAREHNLRDVSVEIPHGKLCVVTGPSGSGKSSLAFDVIFAEGQRRFLETLTPYARQFLPTLPRPDVSRVEGVPPAVALEQRTSRAGSKSTVATVTEVAHYLRLLYAKLGVPHCPDHDSPIANLGFEQVLAEVSSQKGKFELLAPVIQARKGTYLDVFTTAQRSGIERALVDGKWIQTDTPPKLSRSKEHDIDLLLGSQLSAKDVTPELLRLALRWGKGAVRLLFASGEARLISQNSACPTCGLSVPELDPRFFSFNTKQGRCETCEGDGVLSEVRKVGRGKQARSEEVISECPECAGERLGPVPRSVRFSANGSGGVRYPELMNLSVRRAVAEVRTWKLSGDRARIGDAVVQELERRLSFLEEVGLDYLSLDRGARSLSGGEMQRLRLAAQLGSGLTGALYVLDEPTIGLHPRDTSRLVGNLKRLVEQGSTVLVVEHDEDTIRAADYLVDVGPGGGSHGGNIVAVGAPEHVLQQVDSPTAQSLREPPQLRQSIPVEMGAKDHKGKAPAKGKAKKDVSPAGAERTAADQQWLELLGASEHNLKAVDLKLPIGRLSVIAGVSGSGKSTLVRQVLLPALRQKLGLVAETPGAFKKLGDTGTLQRAISVDQSPIGRTPRSVPATFLGIFDDLRRLYAATPEAKVRGFDASRFSFNTPRGGRCTTCDGQGAITHEMSFLPDVITTCPACDGQRFEPSTLEIRYRDLSIGDVLNLSAEQAVAAFENHPRIIQPLRTLVDLGAGYVRLGQGSHTLSGGEAQRLKLAAELTEGARHQPTLYVLDEPTTGLHLRDVGRLVQVLGRLVERGDTLVVIEHHPHVIASADWIVELGPEGGEAGGELVAQGTPAQLRKRKTATGRVLAELLGR
ncbi:MAG: excinuclease ABC subunit UvrA [Polyangiaceae bacterium]|nr:excinuclease ABC subunit UvrA [Polyangiaceae bacterium]MCB9607976.1 excinuclease ABC subunit UvrA [Polyangiaceae bacterium]